MRCIFPICTSSIGLGSTFRCQWHLTVLPKNRSSVSYQFVRKSHFLRVVRDGLSIHCVTENFHLFHRGWQILLFGDIGVKEGGYFSSDLFSIYQCRSDGWFYLSFAYQWSGECETATSVREAHEIFAAINSWRMYWTNNIGADSVADW